MDTEHLNHIDPGVPGPEARPTIPFWSPWAVVGWGLVVAAVYVAVQIAVMVIWLAALDNGPHELHPAASALVSGDLFAVATLAVAAVCVPLIWAIAAVRAGAGTARALALRAPRPRTLAAWLAATALLATASDLVTVAFGRPLVPAFMADLVRATSTPVLLWPAIILAAPLLEELLMRGFVLEGLRRGSLGAAGSVIVTSAAWAGAHLQYDAYEIATIIVFGLLFGAARLRSGSLWVPIAMHVLVNLVATVETLLVLAR